MKEGKYVCVWLLRLALGVEKMTPLELVRLYLTDFIFTLHYLNTISFSSVFLLRKFVAYKMIDFEPCWNNISFKSFVDCCQ